MAPQKLKDQKNSFTSISVCDDERREMPNSLGGPVVGELALPEQNRCFTFRPEGFCSGHHAKRCISANTTGPALAAAGQPPAGLRVIRLS